jgi:alpha-1,3-rhamnosyltransferase
MNTTPPLVSIVVITYNSANYVLETLDSIFSQSYKNLELIVTDDGSQDSTVALCRTWIAAHADRFVRSQLLTVAQNSGIPANCNRGYRAAQGEWIKGIAGDDILADDCIRQNVDYVCQHPDIRVLFSKVRAFRVVDGRKEFLGERPGQDQREIYALEPIEQLKILLAGGNTPAAPTLFLHRSVYGQYQYNEKYRLLEDYPYYINLTLNGIKLHFMDAVTVFYRSGESVSWSDKTLFQLGMSESRRRFFWNEKIDIMRRYAPELIDKNRKEYLLCDLAELLLKNRATRINRLLLRCIRWFINRFRFV